MTIEKPRLSRKSVSIAWDGTNNTGAVREGNFTYELTIDFRKGNQLVVRNREVLKIDTTGPRLATAVEPVFFSPDGDGVDDVTYLSLTASDPNGVANWAIRVLDRNKTPFKLFSGEEAPVERIAWDGLSNVGQLVQSFDSYTVLFEASDKLGNTSRTENTIQTDILVHRTGYRYNIVLSTISFTPLTANYRDASRANYEKNVRIFDKLAEIIKKNSNHKVRIEAHAVATAWQNAKARQTEEDEVLLPLTISRAEAVKEALVERGIAAERISTEGFGGTHPLVPHSDRVNNWKNQRVEIILVR